MKQSSHEAYRAQRLAILFLALGLLFLACSFDLSAAKISAQAGVQIEVKEGQSARWTLTLNNRCSEPHLLRVTSSVKYVMFEQPTVSVLIAAGSNKPVGVRFDATGLSSNVYRSKVTVECLDCPKASRCIQNRYEVPIQITVTRRLTPNCNRL